MTKKTYAFVIKGIGIGETLEEAFEHMCENLFDGLSAEDCEPELLSEEEEEEPVDYAKDNPRDDDVTRWPFKWDG